MRASKKESLVAFLAYLVLAVVMTWPLVARLGTHIPLGNADVWLNYWNLWWWKTALLQGQSPYYTDMIFFPTGVPLGLHTHSPANMLWTLPINLALGMGPALNLAIFTGFAMAGFGGFLLAREYTQQTLPAVLAGIVAAYFPQHVDQATEHLNLASYWAMPLFLWALVRCIRRGGVRWWVATGLFFSLNALLAWHNALLAIPLGIGLAIFELWRGSRPLSRAVLELAGAAVIALLMVTPFLVPVIRDSLADTALLQKRFYHKPIDPVTLLLPHPGQPLWGVLFADLHLKLRSYSSVGGIGYLGIVTLLLSIFAFTPRFREQSVTSMPRRSIPLGAGYLWLSLFGFLLVLSLGETIDTSYFDPPGWFHLPYHWLKHLPVFGFVRLPNRFLVPAMIALSVLAAMGTDRLSERLERRGRRIVIGVLAFAMLIDYAWLPFPMRLIPQSEWPEQVQDLTLSGAILDIPLSHGPTGGFETFLQTRHGQPIVGGYIASNLRATRRQLARYPGLRVVRTPYKPEKLGGLQRGLSETIQEMGIDLVVVHLELTRENLQAARRTVPKDEIDYFHRIRLYNPKSRLPESAMNQIRDELGAKFGEPVFQSSKVEIYRIPSSPE